jgi:RND family efflux transporter MFP subunit
MLLKTRGLTMKRVWRFIMCAAATAAALGCGHHALAEDAKPSQRSVAAERVVDGLTMPFKSYNICFPGIGVIREVKIKEGDVVKGTDVLMVQDDREAKAELKLLELDVNQYPIAAAEAKVRVAEAEFKAKDRLKTAGGGSDLEWEQAKAELEVAKIQVDAARQELKMKEAKRDKQAQKLEEMKLIAGVSGVVREIINDIGSNVDPTKPAVTIVENNPIKVRIYVPALASLYLKPGEKMRVSYDKKTWKDGTVSYLAPQADAASGTRMIYLEVPNPDGDPSGLQAFVELPEKLVATAGADGK